MSRISRLRAPALKESAVIRCLNAGDPFLQVLSYVFTSNVFLFARVSRRCWAIANLELKMRQRIIEERGLTSEKADVLRALKAGKEAALDKLTLEDLALKTYEGNTFLSKVYKTPRFLDWVYQKLSPKFAEGNGFDVMKGLAGFSILDLKIACWRPINEITECVQALPQRDIRRSCFEGVPRLAAQYGHLALLQNMCFPLDDAVCGFTSYGLASGERFNSYAKQALYIAAANGHLPLVRFLLESGAPVTAELSQYVKSGVRVRKNVLHCAIEQRRFRVLKELLQKITAEELNSILPTVVGKAVELGCVESLRLLVNARADVNKKDLTGLAPIQQAVKSKNLDLVDCLLASKADPSPPSVLIKDPVSIAKDNADKPMVALLLRAKSGRNNQALAPTSVSAGVMFNQGV